MARYIQRTVTLQSVSGIDEGGKNYGIKMYTNCSCILMSVLWVNDDPETIQVPPPAEMRLALLNSISYYSDLIYE